jgi:hypothetical protein
MVAARWPLGSRYVLSTFPPTLELGSGFSRIFMVFGTLIPLLAIFGKPAANIMESPHPPF